METKRNAWEAIFSDPELSLNSLRNRAVAGTVCQNGLRSVCWKVYLGYLPTLEVSSWPTILLKQRQRYTDLKRKYIEEPAEKMNKKGEEDLIDNNPLALSESNPWQQFFADTEIRKVIRQDVERTFPEVDFFRKDTVQECLTDILFIYCKLNHDVSYRQGMHELLAPFYWVLALESINLDEIKHESIDLSEQLMKQVLDYNFVEHDAYILFDKLMTYGKSWYEFNEDISSAAKRSQSQTKNPVVATCHRIHHQYLRTADPLLYKHLENLGIEPQLYGIRWIRLLFGREFEIHELLKLWDAIFAQDPTLKIVEYVCLVMLLRLRDQLLLNDYAGCLSMLMRPSHIPKPALIVEQAKHLQENLSQETTLHILQQNDAKAGKEPRTSLFDGLETAETPVPNSYANRQMQQRPPHRRSSQSLTLDNGFSKMRDFNKTIAGVMGTVQKNVNTFGESVLGMGQDGVRNTANISSEFPSNIDRFVQSQKSERAVLSPFLKPNMSSEAAVLMASLNLQMGEMMAKCISMLENELFAPEEPIETITVPEREKELIVKDKDDNDLEIAEKEDKGQGGDYDSDSSSLVKDKKDGSLPKPNAPARNDATLIMALVGLKHVRDVLTGKQTQFDDSVMDVNLDTNTTSNTASPTEEANNEWDIVKRKEAITATPPFTDHQQRTNILNPTTVFVPQTSHSLISKEHTADTIPNSNNNNNYQQSKPLSSLFTKSVAITTTPATALPTCNNPTATAITTPAIKYIPANPAPPKQQIKYTIEDLLSDPELQLSSPKVSTNAKFKWMLSSSEKENGEEKGSSLVSNNNNNNSTATAAYSLFKNEEQPQPQQQQQQPRKKNSVLFNRNRSSFIATDQQRSNSIAVDPLDAKNVDSRKTYEYDVL